MNSEDRNEISGFQIPSNIVTKDGVTTINGRILKTSMIAEEFCKSDEEIEKRRNKFKEMLIKHDNDIDLDACNFLLNPNK